VSFAPDNCLAEYFGAGVELSKCPHGRWSKEELENYKKRLALLLQDAELNAAQALALGAVGSWTSPHDAGQELAPVRARTCSSMTRDR
jgi:hypothetical protein